MSSSQNNNEIYFHFKFLNQNKKLCGPAIFKWKEWCLAFCRNWENKKTNNNSSCLIQLSWQVRIWSNKGLTVFSTSILFKTFIVNLWTVLARNIQINCNKFNGFDIRQKLYINNKFKICFSFRILIELIILSKQLW